MEEKRTAGGAEESAGREGAGRAGGGAFGRMCGAVARGGGADGAEAVLRELLTPAEVRALELRWELLELLAAGTPQREVARRLGVSLCKITRGARILKKRDGEAARFIAAAAASAQTRRKDGDNVAGEP